MHAPNSNPGPVKVWGSHIKRNEFRFLPRQSWKNYAAYNMNLLFYNLLFLYMVRGRRSIDKSKYIYNNFIYMYL